MWEIWSSPYLHSARNTKTVDKHRHQTTLNAYLNCESAIKYSMRFNDVKIPIYQSKKHNDQQFIAEK
jgi:hypothetical protein